MKPGTWLGIGFGAALLVIWGSLLAFDLVGHGAGLGSWPGVLARVLLQCWLNVGLFILAHDAMHGTLVPDHPAANDWAGRVCLFLYAGFSYHRLRAAHFRHHRFSGTETDPDFHAPDPTRFLPWLFAFLRRYFRFREFIGLVLASFGLLWLGVALPRLLIFWALPAILSAVQLFTFGTFLPHRHDDQEFPDHHRTRSQGYPPLLSLITCFHFGYHHEHHCRPDVPWWGLPALRRAGRIR